MYHYRKNRKVYNSYPRPADCQFCDLESMRGSIVEEHEHCYVMPNRTFYDVWELRDVTDHLLVIPKQHCESLGHLGEKERLEIINVAAKYEAEGYNIYARAPGSTQKSVPHQHTHLLKLLDKPGRGIVTLRKPYFLFKF